MNYRHWLFLALTAVPALALRAAAPSDDDEADFSDIGFYANAKNKVTFGFRVTEGAKVKFGRLGAVTLPSYKTDVDGPSYPTAGVNYQYSNGYVAADSLRSNEVKYNADGTVATDANGKYIQTSTPGTRFQTNSGTQYDDNGNVITGDDGKPLVVTTGDFLAYTPGLTRSYSFNQGGQLLEDGSGLEFTQYSTITTGAELDADRGISSGFELSVGRQLKKFAGGKLEFNVVGALSLNDISNKESGDVHAKLHVIKDTFYFVPGGTLPSDLTMPYTAPTFTDYIDEEGGTHTDSLETTVPLQDHPDDSKHVDNPDAGDIEVSGVWKIKGAYFAMRAGAELRAMMSKNFGVTVGAGMAGAYSATRFTAAEQFKIEGIDNPIAVEDFSDKAKFLPGYYANVDASYSLNERTGVYAGVSYEAYDEYEQTVGGRTAKIEIGNAPTVRGGISVKF